MHRRRSRPESSDRPQQEIDPADGDLHPGTTDLDIGLAIVLLDEGRYTEISARLRREGFEPDRNAAGNPTPQRWKARNLPVTVDFLLPPLVGSEQGGTVHPLEGDFGALIAPGLELAMSERASVQVAGRTLTGEEASRAVPVCGPGAFVVLKALALADRGEPKDAFDLIYVLRRWGPGISNIADRLARHSEAHAEVVREALEKLANDFDSVDGLGPRRAAAFDGDASDDAAAADAHGYVADLLTLCRDRGLIGE